MTSDTKKNIIKYFLTDINVFISVYLSFFSFVDNLQAHGIISGIRYDRVRAESAVPAFQHIRGISVPIGMTEKAM